MTKIFLFLCWKNICSTMRQLKVEFAFRDSKSKTLKKTFCKQKKSCQRRKVLGLATNKNEKVCLVHGGGDLMSSSQMTQMYWDFTWCVNGVNKKKKSWTRRSRIFTFSLLRQWPERETTWKAMKFENTELTLIPKKKRQKKSSTTPIKHSNTN